MSSSRLRRLQAEDAEPVAALFRETYGDARRLDAEEIRSWLRNKEIEPEWLQVLEEEGRVVGYGDIWVQEDEVALDVAAPGRWSSFFDWAESAARERGRPRVRVNPPAGHEVAAIAEERGYRPWRSSFTMEIDLHERPPEPSAPDGLTLRSYAAADEESLRTALNAAFADDPFWHTVTPPNFQEFYLRARGFDPSLWLLAWDGADLAGFVLGYPERSGDATLGWVGTLGVLRAWRRRGLGEALLRHSFAKLYDRGLRRVGLGVDAENVTGALRLYERVGMRKTRQVDNWVLDL
jgi:mycothiol synthase